MAASLEDEDAVWGGAGDRVEQGGEVDRGSFGIVVSVLDYLQAHQRAEGFIISPRRCSHIHRVLLGTGASREE